MADARANLKQVQDETLTTEKWREYLASVVEVEKRFKCSNCGRPNMVVIPNVDALIKLLDATGKPPEARRLDVFHHDGDGPPDLTQLTDAQVLAIANGQMVVEGEWKEVGPPELSPAT